jgi:adenylylsulfate kinase-like enzyme
MNRVIWIFGRPGSGKTTLGRALAERSKAVYGRLILLDSDELRAGMNCDLKYGEFHRCENIRRLAELAQVLRKQVPVVVAAVTPLRRFRDMVKIIVPGVELIHLLASESLCARRGKPLWDGTIFEQPADNECVHLSAEERTENQARRLLP